jgi:hypothetical protein
VVSPIAFAYVTITRLQLIASAGGWIAEQLGADRIVESSYRSSVLAATPMVRTDGCEAFLALPAMLIAEELRDRLDRPMRPPRSQANGKEFCLVCFQKSSGVHLRRI